MRTVPACSAAGKSSCSLWPPPYHCFSLPPLPCLPRSHYQHHQVSVEQLQIEGDLAQRPLLLQLAVCICSCAIRSSGCALETTVLCSSSSCQHTGIQRTCLSSLGFMHARLTLVCSSVGHTSICPATTPGAYHLACRECTFTPGIHNCNLHPSRPPAPTPAGSKPPASPGHPVATAAAAAAPAAPKPLYRPPSSHNLSRSNSATDLGRVPSNSNLDVEDRVKGVASHPWHDLPVGGNAPEMFTCVIEIPQVGPVARGSVGHLCWRRVAAPCRHNASDCLGDTSQRQHRHGVIHSRRARASK